MADDPPPISPPPSQEAAAQLAKYKGHYSTLLESLGPEDSVTKEVAKKIQNLEGSVSDLGQAKDLNAISSLKLRLEKEKKSQLDFYTEWKAAMIKQEQHMEQALVAFRSQAAEETRQAEAQQQWKKPT